MDTWRHGEHHSIRVGDAPDCGDEHRAILGGCRRVGCNGYKVLGSCLPPSKQCGICSTYRVTNRLLYLNPPKPTWALHPHYTTCVLVQASIHVVCCAPRCIDGSRYFALRLLFRNSMPTRVVSLLSLALSRTLLLSYAGLQGLTLGLLQQFVTYNNSSPHTLPCARPPHPLSARLPRDPFCRHSLPSLHPTFPQPLVPTINLVPTTSSTIQPFTSTPFVVVAVYLAAVLKLVFSVAPIV